MSKYTTEVRFICEDAAGLTDSEGYSSINTVLESARAKVFDFDFPIFDEAYRPILEKKILKHYYTREICCETVGLWKHYLDMKMNEIMPYYNQLYKSELLEFNPLYDVDLTTDYQKVDNGNNSKARNIAEEGSYSDTDKYKEENNHEETINVEEEKRKSGSTVVDEDKTHANTKIIDENISGTEHVVGGENTDGTTGSTTSNTSANKNDHWEYFSDTPEGGINGLSPSASALGQNNYLTTATHITDDGTGSTSGSTVSGTSHSETDTTKDTTTSGERDVNENVSGSDTKDSTTTTSDTENIDGETTKGGSDTKESERNKSGSNEKQVSDNSTETLKNIEDYLQHVVGKKGGASYSKMLEEFRNTFLNIDMMIIKDLRPLFFNLW